MNDLYGGGPVSDRRPRCWRCNRLLAELVSRPWRIHCVRCKAMNQDGIRSESELEAVASQAERAPRGPA